MNKRTRNALDRFLTTDPYEYGLADSTTLPAEPDTADLPAIIDDAAQDAATKNEQATKAAEKTA